MKATTMEHSARLEKVLKQIAAGQLAEGLDALTRLAAEDSAERPAVLGHLAWLQRQTGDFEGSAESYRQLLAIRPTPDAHAWLGDVLYSLQKPDEGEEQLRQAAALDPFNSSVLDCLNRHARRETPREPADTRRTPIANQSPAPNPILAALESDKSSYPDSIFPEVGRMIYHLVRLVRPRLALETGSYIGYSAVCMAQAMKDNEFGHLHAFDLFEQKEDYVSPVLGPMTDGLKIVRGHLVEAGVDHLVTIHKGDSSSNIRTAMQDSRGILDFAFIDGDHRIEGVQKDWAAVDEVLAEGGVILLHDTEPRVCTWMGPRHLLENLDSIDAYRWLNLPSPEGFGLAIAQKVRSKSWKACTPSFVELVHERVMRKAHWG